MCWPTPIRLGGALRAIHGSAHGDPAHEFRGRVAKFLLLWEPVANRGAGLSVPLADGAVLGHCASRHPVSILAGAQLFPLEGRPSERWRGGYRRRRDGQWGDRSRCWIGLRRGRKRFGRLLGLRWARRVFQGKTLT